MYKALTLTMPNQEFLDNRIRPLLFEIFDETEELRFTNPGKVFDEEIKKSGVHYVRGDNGIEVWIDVFYIIYRFVQKFNEKPEATVTQRALTTIWKELIGKDWREVTRAQRTHFTLTNEEQIDLFERSVIRGKRYCLPHAVVEKIVESEWENDF